MLCVGVVLCWMCDLGKQYMHVVQKKNYKYFLLIRFGPIRSRNKAQVYVSPNFIWISQSLLGTTDPFAQGGRTQDGPSQPLVVG